MSTQSNDPKYKQLGFFWIPFFPPAETPEPEKPKTQDKDGRICINCKQFYPYAESNQPDGSFKCYSCRMNW